jgi:CheY-like chemotaxis protein
VETGRDAPDKWWAKARLPFAAAPSEEDQAETDNAGSLNILAVDDHAGNRRLIELILNALGHQVSVVEDGAQAVAAVQAGDYDLILMDLMMPVMNGYEAARCIRALPAPKSQAPIIALTADASPEAHLEAEAAGMDAVLTKPVEIHRLAATLNLLAPRRVAQGLVQAAEVDHVECKNYCQKRNDYCDRDHRANSARAESA